MCPIVELEKIITSMTAVNVFTLIKDAVVAVAAVITAIVAWRGLGTWQKELKGKADFDIARSLIRATYKLRDEIELCRYSFISINEYPDDYNPQATRLAEEEGRLYAFIYGRRWKPVLQAIQEFDSFALEAEVLWGANIKKKTKEFRQCTKELQVAIEAVIDDKRSGGTDFLADAEYAKEMKGKVSTLKKDEDSLTIQIKTAIEAIEAEISPHLNRDKQ